MVVGVVGEYLTSLALYVAGAALLAVPLVLIILLKDKVSFFPGRKKDLFSVWIYTLNEGAKLDDLGHVTKEEDITLQEIRNGWKVKKTLRESLYLDLGSLQGVDLDIAYLLTSRTPPFSQPVIRILRLYPDRKRAESYYPIDVPPAIDVKRFRESVTGLQSRAMNVGKQELLRPKQNLEWTQWVLPIIAIIAAVVIVIVSVDSLSKAQDKAAGAYIAAISASDERNARNVCVSKYGVNEELVRQCTKIIMGQNELNTTQNVIPFVKS